MKVCKIIISLLLVVFSLGGFYSVHRAVSVAEASNWIVPIIWFSLFGTVLFLASVIFKEKRQLGLIITLALVPSLFFSFEILRLLDLAIGFFLILWGNGNISDDLNSNVKISIWKTLKTGKIKIVLAIALLIAMQYYSEAKKYHVQSPPKLQIDKVVVMIFPKLMATFSPEFRNDDNEKLTVDEFIIKVQKIQAENFENPASIQESEVDKIIESQFGSQISYSQKELLKKEVLEKLTANPLEVDGAVLAAGRKQLSELSGLDITGQEKISEVFLVIINNKIDAFFAANLEENDGTPVLPLIFALILFLILLPLGNFLSFFWMILASGLFKLLLIFQVVRIKKIPAEIEVIEY